MLQESPGTKAPFATDAPLASPAPLNLRRSEAARYLNGKFGFPCSKAWLAKLACVGGGPEYLLAGKFPIYPIESLDTWALARISAPRRSTSDRGQR
jgi:hypothetical protein